MMLRHALYMAKANESTANKTTAAKWVKMAREQADREMGSSAGLLTARVRFGIESAQLVGIIAAQDESVRNGETMVLACEMLMEVNENGAY